MRILHSVVEKNQALGHRSTQTSADSGSMLNQALQQAARVAKHDCLISTISDFSGADAETVQLATTLSRGNDLLNIVIYDPMEAELPDGGRLVMSSDGLQLEVDTSSQSLRKRFKEDFSAKMTRLEEISRRRSIPVLPIQTGEGVAEQVRSILGHRQPAR